MPSWQPNWNNVNWNHGAAGDAANELRRAADLLEETAARRKHAADTARREWRGRYRDEFDHNLDDMLRRARELAERMRHKAREIDDAGNRAREQQRHRERERERWHHEKREEERREEEQRKSGQKK